MPDAIDRLQEQEAEFHQRALSAHAAQLPRRGRDMCADEDCGEPISERRKALGAQLCLACQHAAEQRAGRGR